MDGVSPPAQPEQPVPIIPADILRRLLDACSGARFEDRRDTAMLRLLASTGVRAGELMGLAVDDVDLRHGTFTVLGKGRRRRASSNCYRRPPKPSTGTSGCGATSVPSSPMLWIGAKGPLSTSGLRQMLERRCHQAGLEPINAHRFRHTFAHEAKSLGMSTTS